MRGEGTLWRHPAPLHLAAREHPFSRPPARPLRVLAAGRRLQDRQSRGPLRGTRHAGAGPHRSRGAERRRRVLQGLPQARREADPRPRGLSLRQPPRPREGPLRAQPPDAPGPQRGGFPEPDQALLARVPRRVPARPGERRHGAARPPLGGRDRAQRVPAVALLPAHHPGARAGGARPRGRAAGRVRRRERLLRGPEQQDPRAGPGERGDRADRAGAGPAADRHGRRPLPAPRGLRHPLRAAVRADEVDAGAAEAALRHQRVLFEEPRRDGGVVRAVARGGADVARDRRALRHHARARQDDAAGLSDARRQRADRVPAPAHRAGAARALRRPAARRGARAPRDRAARDRGHGLRVLLPDRVGLREIREGQRHRGRPGPRIRRGLDRELRPAHHGRRPARLGPAVRAVPQRGAQDDAGHRHRLLDPRPRARDQVRPGEVRARRGRPDHHVRQDEAARGHPRRGARAGRRLRDGRPAREADPRADHGPDPLASKSASRRAASCARSTSPTPRQST